MLKKAYFWPEYNAGKVDKITSINNDSDVKLNYIKKSASDAVLQNSAHAGHNEVKYTPKGGLANSYIQGSMFEALA